VPAGAYCPLHFEQRRVERIESAALAANRRDEDTEHPQAEAHALARKIRGTAQWQKARAVIITQQPVCSNPFGYHSAEAPRLASQVHHIRALIVAPHLAFDPSNLASVCTACHARLEGIERRGKPTAYLFERYERRDSHDDMARGIAKE
jgi:5-methylcytosine-specific restriction endonuclease McrA